MIPQLDAPALARMITEVTQSIFGASFALVGDTMSSDSAWRTIGIRIYGPTPLLVALSADESSATELSAAMFSCPQAEVDGAMIDDALGEIVNIVAGQMKVTLGVNHALGLPGVVTSHLAGLSQAAMLSVQDRPGAIRVCLTVSEAA